MLNNDFFCYFFRTLPYFKQVNAVGEYRNIHIKYIAFYSQTINQQTLKVKKFNVFLFS